MSLAIARPDAAALPAIETAFALAASDFDHVRQPIYEYAGISLNPGKQAMVYSRLSRRLREPATARLRATCSGSNNSTSATPSGRPSSIA